MRRSIFIAALNPYAARTGEIENGQIPPHSRRPIRPCVELGDKLATRCYCFSNWLFTRCACSHTGLPPKRAEIEKVRIHAKQGFNIRAANFNLQHASVPTADVFAPPKCRYFCWSAICQ